MATTLSHRLPTAQAPAIAGLTGYEDADTLRWQSPCMGAQDRDPGTDGQAPHGAALPGSAARWPTNEAPASMNVKLKVGNMELIYTARDTNDQDLQDRMAKVLPWLAEVMAACEANYHARQQAAKQAAEPSTPPPPAPAPERTLAQQSAAASPNGAGPAANGRPTPPPPASERPNDLDPSWCPIHQCRMSQHSNARGSWYSHRLPSGAYCKGA